MLMINKDVYTSDWLNKQFSVLALLLWKGHYTDLIFTNNELIEI